MKCHACGFIGPVRDRDNRTTPYEESFHSQVYTYPGDDGINRIFHSDTFYSCPKCGTLKKYVSSDSLKINGGNRDDL